MKISKLCALALLLAAFCTPNVYAQDVGDDPFDDGGAAMEESAPMDGGEGEDAFAEPPAEEEPQPVAKPEPAKAKPAAKKKEMKKAKKEAKKKKVAKKAKGKKAGKKKKEKKDI